MTAATGSNPINSFCGRHIHRKSLVLKKEKRE
ncbi:hypothetical protein predicted by Glimmer/Critica [Bdellovibrio bacteriovorus HD100]|uniref:Uncharacterized protein n=1 Tax=Bdellovibrio bacteriovorus (strain ATCC 15356 / DSM 50701 / NCIMB 9529 / HD100) TaxID=264462 RepID=Q6MJV2_BDEBA|nr:hypothetical protein predicted by Glimmer/Critica [Bdellovibrio bacteriovorus HD100]